MVLTSNPRLIFNEIPTGYPVPGRTTIYDVEPTIDLDAKISGPNGEPAMLVKTLCLSVDPYFRTRMRKPEVESYLPAFKIGEPLEAFGVGVVLKSTLDGFKPGDYINSPIFKMQAYNIFTADYPAIILKNEEGIPWPDYLGVAGMPGKTAFFGLKVLEPKKGETIFVTTAAGAVGSLVCQLAKAAGLKVIGSTGSDDKVKYLESIGVDVAFNYKTTAIADVLMKEGPIDLYWDNIGGETLETAFTFCKPRARVLACGFISEYNTGENYGIKNTSLIMSKRIIVYGFFVSDHEDKWEAEFYATVPKMIASGQLVVPAQQITKGLKNAGEAIRDVQMGTNTGKSVVWVADE